MRVQFSSVLLIIGTKTQNAKNKSKLMFKDLASKNEITESSPRARDLAKWLESSPGTLVLVRS